MQQLPDGDITQQGLIFASFKASKIFTSFFPRIF